MRRASVVLAVLAAFVLGLVTGSLVVSRMVARGMAALTEGRPADLATYVFVAARLRQADTQPVADFLERQIDANVLTVAALPASQRAAGSPADKALRSAKLYRSSYPTTGGQVAEVARALDGIAADGPAYNETMLRGLAAQTPQGAPGG